MQDEKFIIIYDTYCGWCYGAAPIFDELVAIGANIEALHRHLFKGPLAYRLSQGKGDLVLAADARINALTDQVFSKKYTDNIVLSDAEILESKYTAQAAALVHEQGVEKEFSVRKRLEKARYIDGISASDREVVVNALEQEGVAPQEAQKIGTPEAQLLADKISKRAEYLMDQVGAQGVPTILKVTNNKIRQIDHSAFYGSPKNIKSIAV